MFFFASLWSIFGVGCCILINIYNIYNCIHNFGHFCFGNYVEMSEKYFFPRKACLICEGDLDIFALGECEHASLCIRCHLKNKLLYGKDDCSVCKYKLNKVVVTAQANKKFSSFEFDHLYYSSKIGDFFDNKSHLIFAEKLISNCCPICKQDQGNIKRLKAHVSEKHSKNFCITCLAKRKVFPIEQRIYNDADLRRHQREGDPAVGDDGAIEVHIRCNLCKCWCYNTDDYNSHTIQTHVSCQICRRISRNSSVNSRVEIWLANTERLIDHYKEEHLTCEFDECLANPIENVFEDEISLQAHVLKVHGRQVKKQDKKQAQRLLFDIKYKRSDENLGRLTASIENDSTNNPSDEYPDPVRRSKSENSLGEEDANAFLMSEMRRVVGEAGLALFREASARYYSHELDAQQYYDEFCRLFRGASSAGALWMRLVSTLPDYSLREQLYNIHYAAVRQGGGFNIVHPPSGDNVNKNGSGKEMTKENTKKKSDNKIPKGTEDKKRNHKRGCEQTMSLQDASLAGSVQVCL